MQGYLELSRYPDKENVEKYVQKVCFAWCCSVFIRESMLRCRVSQQVRFDTCNLWQRIRELGADPDLLGYVWDGGSSYEYVQPDKNVGSGLSQPDGQLALTTLPHNLYMAGAAAAGGAGHGRERGPQMPNCSCTWWQPSWTQGSGAPTPSVNVHLDPHLD